MKNLFIGVLFIIIAIALTHTSFAQSSLLFTVSPARQQVVANPGEEFPISVSFFNQSESPVVGLIKVSDFIVEDDKGTPTIIENENLISPKYSASKWVVLPYSRISIGTNNKAVVIASVRIPRDAKPGGRYAAVYFEPITAAKTTGGAGANITPRIASLIYIRVAGPIVENAFISSMFTASFYEYGPVDVYAKIMNKGYFHIRPRGAFTLTNFFGTKTDESKLKEANIFPETQYSFQSKVGQKWMMGKYKIILAATYGSKEQTVGHTVSVVVFPWRVSLVVFLSIVILSIVGRYFYTSFLKKEANLEKKLTKQDEEIEKLKKQLENKS